MDINYINNVRDYQLQPYYHHHRDDRRLMVAEHHHPPPLVVHHDSTFVLETLPPGFKFLPTDLELIEFYLKPKLQNWFFPPELKKPFLEVELYKYNPDELIGMHEKLEEDQESWYFLTPRERKYQKGSRPRRTAGNGYWMAATKDTAIVDSDEVVGYKKVLDFYIGKHGKGERSEWKMHEYLTKEQKDNPNLPSTSQNPNKLNDWVLCKIYKNQRGTKRKHQSKEEFEEKNKADDLQSNEEFEEKNKADDQRGIDALLNDDLFYENEDFWMNLYTSTLT